MIKRAVFNNSFYSGLSFPLSESNGHFEAFRKSFKGVTFLTLKNFLSSTSELAQTVQNQRSLILMTSYGRPVNVQIGTMRQR